MALARLRLLLFVFLRVSIHPIPAVAVKDICSECGQIRSSPGEYQGIPVNINVFVKSSPSLEKRFEIIYALKKVILQS